MSCRSKPGKNCLLDAIINKKPLSPIDSPQRQNRSGSSRGLSRSRGRDRSRRRSRSRSRSYHKRTQKFLRRAIGKDDSSDEEEEYRRSDMTALGDMLSRNGLKSTNASYLPEPKVVVKLSEQAKRSSYHPESKRPMCIAVSQFDDKK